MLHFGIGTAQFGMDYGVTNKSGIPLKNEIKKILYFAKKNNISFIDTASLYGNSEKIIGSCMEEKNYFKIITKTLKFENKVIKNTDTILLKDTFHDSLKKLKLRNIFGLLVHRPKDLLKENGELLYLEMLRLKEQKLVQKIGISSYCKSEVNEIIKRFKIDLVQIPINIFNQEMLKNNFLKKLKSMNIEIHARTIFLQGVFFENYTSGIKSLRKLDPYLNKLKLVLKKKNISVAEAALSFVDQIKEIDVGIIGVLDTLQLQEVMLLNRKKRKVNFLKKFSIKNKSLTNPAEWKT